VNISQETYVQYWDKGWVVIEGVFTSDKVDRIAQIALEVSDEEINQGGSPNDSVDYLVDGKVTPRKVNNPFEKGSAFQSFVLDPRLCRIIRDLIGVQPMLFGD